jgi:RNA polymerase sigma factor (sigma-70 family)
MTPSTPSGFSVRSSADTVERDDHELLAEFARGSESAFTALVRRHIDAVYSSALRQVQDAHTAADVTSTVFLILARKAKGLAPGTVLLAWLHRTARFVALKAIRAQRRRQHYEQQAARMQDTLSTADTVAVWEEVAPLLDDGLTQLPAKDHEVVVLRFFQGRTFPQIAAIVGSTEEGARKRVDRAVEKLRCFLTRRGVIVPAPLLIATVVANAVKPSPPTLAASISAACSAGASTPFLRETLQTLQRRRWKPIAASLAVLLLGLVVTHFAMQSRSAIRLSSPLQTFRLLTQAANEGDGERWSSLVHVTNTEEQQVRTLLASNVVAQSELRRALIQRFGQAAYEASGFPRLFDDTPESQLAAATERITGDRAVLHLPRGSNLKFVLVNRTWKFDFFRTTSAQLAQLRSAFERATVALREVARQLAEGRYDSASAACRLPTLAIVTRRR